MAKYILAYHGGVGFETKEEGMAHMAKWNAWVDGMGGAALDRGMPVGASSTVSSDGVTEGGGANPLSGISVILADSLDAALDMAKACPHLDIGGTIEVAKVMEM
jgi:hypothetical protein